MTLTNIFTASSSCWQAASKAACCKCWCGRPVCSTEDMASGLPNFAHQTRGPKTNSRADTALAAAPARFLPRGACQYLLPTSAGKQHGRGMWASRQARVSLCTMGNGRVELGTRTRQGGCRQGDAGVTQFGRSQLHVGIVAASQWKVDAELRIEQREHVQAAVLFHASHAGSHINRDPQLMSREASHNHAATCLGFHRMRSACTETFFALAHADLLFRRTVSRSNCDPTVLPHIGLKKGSGGCCEGHCKLVDVFVFVRLAVSG